MQLIAYIAPKCMVGTYTAKCHFYHLNFRYYNSSRMDSANLQWNFTSGRHHFAITDAWYDLNRDTYSIFIEHQHQQWQRKHTDP